MSKKLAVLFAGVLALAMATSTAWGVCNVTTTNKIGNDPAAPPNPSVQLTFPAGNVPPVAAAAIAQEGVRERVTDVLVYDDNVAPACFSAGNTLRFTYNAAIFPASVDATTTNNIDVYDSAGNAGLTVHASTSQGLSVGGTLETVITVTVDQAGTVGGGATGLTGFPTGSAIRIKNLRVDAENIAIATPNVTATVSASAAGSLVTVVKNVGLVSKLIAAGAAITQVGSANQSSNATLTTPATFAFGETAGQPVGFKVAAGSCQGGGTTCLSGVNNDIATNATSLILDAGTSIPSGVTVTWPATMNNSTNDVVSLAPQIIFTLRAGQPTSCTGSAACSVIYDTTTNDGGDSFTLAVGSAAAPAGAATAAGTNPTGPRIGIVVGSPSGSGSATLHAAFGPGVAAGTGADDTTGNGGTAPRYVQANTSAAAVTRNIFSGTWFTINPINVNLLYRFVSTGGSFGTVTGLVVSNTGNDTGVFTGTAAQTGGLTFYFFGKDSGGNAVTFSLKTDTANGGVGAAAGRGLDANGRLAPGAVFAGSADGLLALARTAGATTATSFEGYVVVVTSFQWAHGFTYVQAGNAALSVPAAVMAPGTAARTAAQTGESLTE